jgi:hypothetical protein
MGVHKSHYRLLEPVVEMAQLSKLLLAIEAGNASQIVGKKLSDIQLSGDERFTCRRHNLKFSFRLQRA